MPTACPAKPVSRVRCKWNQRGCTRFRVRSRFPRVDRLLISQAASHAACLKYKFPLPSYLSVRQPKAAGKDGRGGGGRISIEERNQRSCLPHGRRVWAERPNGLLIAGIAAGILLQSAR